MGYGLRVTGYGLWVTGRGQKKEDASGEGTEKPSVESLVLKKMAYMW